ncbi:Aspartic peptidase [Gracilaria domingensis]|nr:Aspartic peptidase [Gracilaria domingensis]
MCDLLTLTPSPTSRRVTVADGTAAKVLGGVKEVPIAFGENGVQVDFFGVQITPFDVIIGSQTLETLWRRLDLGRQQVQRTAVDGEVVLELSNELQRVDESRTDSGDFTSPDECAEGEYPQKSSSSFSEKESSEDFSLVLAIVNEATYEPHLGVMQEEKHSPYEVSEEQKDKQLGRANEPSERDRHHRLGYKRAMPVE